SGNVDDRRGMGGKGKLVAGGGVIALIVIALQFFGGETGQQLAPIVEQLGGTQTQQTEQRELTAQEKEVGNFVATVLADTEDVWNHIFADNNLGDYAEPTMVLFTDAVSTACGNASS